MALFRHSVGSVVLSKPYFYKRNVLFVTGSEFYQRFMTKRAAAAPAGGQGK